MNRLLVFGPYRLDVVRRVLLRGEELVPLPSKAIDVLSALVKQTGQVVSKDDLMAAVWPDAFVEEGNLSQNIHLLRKALQDKAEEHRYILTVPGRGYSFVASIEELAPGSEMRVVPAVVAPAESDRLNPVSVNRKTRYAEFWEFARRERRKIFVIGGLTLAGLLVLGGLLSPVARHFNNRGHELKQRGELQAAIFNYRLAVLVRPSYAKALYNLADAYEDIPDYEKAIEQYQKAIDMDAGFYEAYNNLARLYLLRRRDPGAALRLIDRALRSNPQENSVRYSLHKNYGWANNELRNYGRSEEELRGAITLSADRGSAHCLLAKVLVAQGRAAEAYREWESCLAYSSQSEVEPEWRNEAQEQIARKEGK